MHKLVKAGSGNDAIGKAKFRFGSISQFFLCGVASFEVGVHDFNFLAQGWSFAASIVLQQIERIHVNVDCPLHKHAKADSYRDWVGLYAELGQIGC
ncbi:MAG TPA: hypothetical protein DHU81_09315 [Hyphomonas sp.]|mgnify:CR=1 FL=1|nr:hypothetical protein [Hyphomonas sp.]